MAKVTKKKPTKEDRLKANFKYAQEKMVRSIREELLKDFGIQPEDKIKYFETVQEYVNFYSDIRYALTSVADTFYKAVMGRCYDENDDPDLVLAANVNNRKLMTINQVRELFRKPVGLFVDVGDIYGGLGYGRRLGKIGENRYCYLGFDGPARDGDEDLYLVKVLEHSLAKRTCGAFKMIPTPLELEVETQTSDGTLVSKGRTMLIEITRHPPLFLQL